ncbi:MAG: response regulator [Candidatus Aminicenantes bacterium]|jgi:CheY-like chemotaxis protein
MGNEDQDVAKETGQASLYPQHVLLIDDESVVREIGCEMLESLGYQCIPAESGEEGIQLYKENIDKIVLVILDIEMPGLSGDKIYVILKELNPDLKILLISGYARNYLEARYFKQKLNHSIFMAKPFQLGQLAKKLETIMGT